MTTSVSHGQYVWPRIWGATAWGVVAGLGLWPLWSMLLNRPAPAWYWCVAVITGLPVLAFAAASLALLGPATIRLPKTRTGLVAAWGFSLALAFVAGLLITLFADPNASQVWNPTAMLFGAVPGLVLARYGLLVQTLEGVVLARPNGRPPRTLRRMTPKEYGAWHPDHPDHSRFLQQQDEALAPGDPE